MVRAIDNARRVCKYSAMERVADIHDPWRDTLISSLENFVPYRYASSKRPILLLYAARTKKFLPKGRTSFSEKKELKWLSSKPKR